MSIHIVKNLLEKIIQEEVSILEAEYISPPEDSVEETPKQTLTFGTLPPIGDFKEAFEREGGYYHKLNSHDQTVWDLSLMLAGHDVLDERDSDQLYQGLLALTGVPEEKEIVRIGRENNHELLTKYKDYVKRYAENISASERENFLSDEAATLASDILNVLGYESI